MSAARERPLAFGRPQPRARRRRPGERRLRAPSHVRVIQWPGQSERGAPDDFPGGSRDAGAPAGEPPTPDAGTDDEAPPIVISSNPGFRRASSTPDEAAGPEGVEEPEERRRRREAVWRAAGAAPRGFNRLVAAVYAALADPLVGGSPETRARRAAQIRRAGTVAASAALGLVLIYAIFPVRTYLDQRSATQRTLEERDVLRQANERMAERAEELRDDETVEEIARRDYGLVFPGEEPYAVLPPPVGTTSTTPTTTP